MGIFRTVMVFCLGVIVLEAVLTKPNSWEYRTEVVSAKTSTLADDLGGEFPKLASAYFDLDDEVLSRLGAYGWELVGSEVEVETVHPNFGKGDYVTGLQPNTRPSRLILFFKRPVPWWAHLVRHLYQRR